VDERATLGGLESEDDAKPSHGLLAVLSSLWGRGHPPHGLRIRVPEDQGVRRPKHPDQPRRLAGPTRGGSGVALLHSARYSSRCGATTPEAFGPEASKWELGASPAIGRPRAPQAHSSLGRALHHRQDLEARNIKSGQRPRRGLQQRLEHPTAMSLLPLRCFKSFMYLVYIHK
jgi:hypothetical protein